MRKKATERVRQRMLALAISATLATSILGVGSPVNGSELSAFFDWRLSDHPTNRNSATDSLSIVPSVKNQGEFGTCWAFASIGAY